MGGFWSSETMHARLPAEGIVEPFIAGRVVNCSYELGLGHQATLTGADMIRRSIDDEGCIEIPPGQFAQLLTDELVRIPADSLGFISIRSKFKFRGLVNVSGFHVDPGYTGRLIFSVYNAGSTTVTISRGRPAFLLWLCHLDQVTSNTYDKAPRLEIDDEEAMRVQGDVFTPQALASRLNRISERMDKVEGRWSRRRERLWDFVIGLVLVILGAAAGSALTLWLDDDAPASPPADTVVTSTTSP